MDVQGLLWIRRPEQEAFTLLKLFRNQNFVQLYTTQASPDDEEVMDHFLCTVLTDIENNPTSSWEACFIYVDKLCKSGNFSSALRLLKLLHDKGIFLGQNAYDSLLAMATEGNEMDFSSYIFKYLLVSRESLSSAAYLSIAKVFAKQSERSHLLRFVKEITELASPKSTPVLNRIIYSFAECGQIDKALLIFDQLESVKCKRDLITYNTILDVLGRVGRLNEMLHEFAAMKEASISPDVVTYNTLLNSLRKAGRLDICSSIWKEMKESGVQPDLLTYTALIECFGRSGNVHQSLTLFHEMKLKQIRPSIYIYRSLISNLKKMGKVEVAMAISEEMNSSLSELAGPKDFKRNKR
ncbi:pentatricopeptide repeat-containing protein At1g11900 isoform X2 [Rhodamnia argentea]|uniref:Pentatricopeptide repeat-containing protein At1g11900 isoform X2 n=1 Tax=Rhodamnia argentea TaxID=178133 RepID=A0ABM3GSS5_9MYRT|nr:pentatricopeptide repeat-containing protein At1g11900 isoform X2 [Rhodamnia argentea]XP_048127402.1 pentatricopeptide repeat-containing protein At1g11900 isoform X2 [Rhodamnia argentea]